MKDLYVIDVSAVVHTGANSQFFRDRRFYNYPVGGIHYLMRHVCNAFCCGDSVVLCFDSPSFRKDLNEGYKDGRLRSPEVISQIETIYDGLMSCGCECYKFDGYEADDIVEWSISDLHDSFYETTIIGNDYDLCHSIRPGVQFKSIAPGVGCIYEGNFEHSVEPGAAIKFNTISARKAFCGCKSDKIPGIKLANGMRSNEVYCKFVEWLGTLERGYSYQMTSYWKTPLVFANVCGFFSEEEKAELFKNVKLVYPAEKPEGVIIRAVNYKDVDKDRLFKFLSLYNDFESIKCLGGRKVDLNENDKQLLRDKSARLSSGEFAADKNLQHQPRVAVKTLELDSFIKEY